MASMNPLTTEKLWGGESLGRAKKHQEAWGHCCSPTSTEVSQYLTITSAIPMSRTGEQERNFKKRGEGFLGPVDAP